MDAGREWREASSSLWRVKEGVTANLSVEKGRKPGQRLLVPLDLMLKEELIQGYQKWDCLRVEHNHPQLWPVVGGQGVGDLGKAGGLKFRPVTEEVDLQEYVDLEDARRHIDVLSAALYNCRHLHSSLGYVPPAEFGARYTTSRR